MKKEKLNPEISGILNVFLFSITPVIIGASSLLFLQKLFFSRAISLLFLLFLVLFNRDIPIKEVFKINLKQLNYLFVVGLLRVVMCCLYYFALSNGPIIENTLISFSWPLFLNLFSIDESRSSFKKSDSLCFTLGLIGAFLVIIKGKNIEELILFHHTYIFSLAYAIIGGYYFYNHKNMSNACISRFSNKSLSSHSLLLLYQEVASFFIISLILIFTDYSLSIAANEMLLMVILGIIGHALPQIFLSYAKSNLALSNFSSQRFLTPVVCSTYLCLFYGENIFSSTLIGALLVLSSFFLQRFNQKKAV